jgi:DNA-binding Xre family transcriptional regulator
MAQTKNANWAAARVLAPPEDYGSKEWVEHYSQHPDILTKMLGDLYRVYKSEEEKRNGTANPAGGRRKAHINGNLDELWSIITPKFATVPLEQAVKEARGAISERALAAKVGIERRTLARMLKGEARVERSDLERLAKALHVHPAYFMEWRLMVVQDLVAQVFAATPNASVTMLRALRPC